MLGGGAGISSFSGKKAEVRNRLSWKIEIFKDRFRPIALSKELSKEVVRRRLRDREAR